MGNIFTIAFIIAVIVIVTAIISLNSNNTNTPTPPTPTPPTPPTPPPIPPTPPTPPPIPPLITSCICNENMKRVLVAILNNGSRLRVNISISGRGSYLEESILSIPLNSINYDGSFVDVNNESIDSSLINGIRLIEGFFDIDRFSDTLYPSEDINRFTCSKSELNGINTSAIEFENLPGQNYNVRFTDNSLRNYIYFKYNGPNSIVNNYGGVKFLNDGSTVNSSIQNIIINDCLYSTLIDV